MTPDVAYKNMEQKFTSANSIPVERAVILREEWEAIKRLLPACDHAFVYGFVAGIIGAITCVTALVLIGSIRFVGG